MRYPHILLALLLSSLLSITFAVNAFDDGGIVFAQVQKPKSQTVTPQKTTPVTPPTPTAPQKTTPADRVKEVAPVAPILISLTYPVGFSPKVFTKGWLFGARCMKGSVDISGNVRWKGTGTFNPDRGPLSRPSFNSPGTNQITLYIEENGKVVFEKTFTVEAVDPMGYARLNDIAQCPPHAHGCPACPHTVQGPIKSGSPLVFIGGIPAARVGDNGIHAVCCGPNTFVIKTGDPNVLIEGKPAARLGDQTLHCNAFTGKIGVLVNR